MDKLIVAREELGVATHLYLNDVSPISTWVLTSAAWEILRGLNKIQNNTSFVNLLSSDEKGVTAEDIIKEAHKTNNAFKHLFDHDRKTLRNDTEIFNSFNDEMNDFLLLLAWGDYGQLANKKPIEAQVFEVWVMAQLRFIKRDKINPNHMPNIEKMFYRQLSRADKKLEMRKAIAHFKELGIYDNSDKTEKSLLLSVPAASST